MISPAHYAYELPEECIAQEPAEPRDAARMLVYDTARNEIHFDRFWNLAKYLPKKSVLVLNKTRVVPARVTLRKPSGGGVQALFLVNEQGIEERRVRALLDHGVPFGTSLVFPPGEACKVVGQEASIFTFELPFGRGELIRLLEAHGTTPIPPYIKHAPLSERELRAKYQTVFAKTMNNGHSNILENVGMSSVAAPTASLHFTPRVFDRLRKKGITREFLTLHVGLGTFAPVTAAQVNAKKLHAEYFDIDAHTACAVSKEKNEGHPLVAAGTTVVRALESAMFKRDKKFFVRSGSQTTDVFVQPLHRFVAPDILITNFHVPRSSLMMLVDAFLQHKGAKRRILDLYKIALREKFRFFSFGDAMLIR
jgi:S-adenosylmethionine:tRNA ribosyltransferase-isomerase